MLEGFGLGRRRCELDGLPLFVHGGIFGTELAELFPEIRDAEDRLDALVDEECDQL